jgi:hypothetical protein
MMWFFDGKKRCRDAEVAIFFSRTTPVAHDKLGPDCNRDRPEWYQQSDHDEIFEKCKTAPRKE